MSDPQGPSGPEPQTRLDFERPAPERAPSGLRLVVDADGIGWILFDAPGEKVNTLSTPVMEALRDALDEAQRRGVKALAFASDKPRMFLAGAAVEEIAGITDPQRGAEKAAYGQAIFEAIAQFPRPTAAVITGPCLGGGYELALACRWCIAENSDAVKVGLPEVRLGILPGFGGTQRLPRRVGIPTALDIILAGKTVPAKAAFKRGMVDALVPPGMGRAVAREVLTGVRKLPPHRLGRTEKAMAAVPLLRNYAFGKARGAFAKAAPREQYPAPHLALEAVAAGFRMGEVAAYRNEARLVGEAVVTPASKNLTWLFQVSGQSKQPRGLDLSQARQVKRLAVAGAGVMGGGIAWLAAEGGYPIRVKDIAAPALAGALDTAAGIWAKGVRRRRLTAAERDRRLERLSFTLDYTGFGLAQVAIEAVVENLAVKRKVMNELEAVMGDDAVLATNTSSLRVGDIAEASVRPERIVGLHFFNPVDRMPLVEVVAGPRSASWAVATAYKLALDLGKTPILVKDGPGFLVNRLLAFYLGEALALFESGADPEAVDAVLTGFGMPMGPFALLDQIGLDVADKVTHVVEQDFGDRLPRQATLGRLVERGDLGKKSGRGFFVYGSGRERPVSPAAAAAAGSPTRRVYAADDMLDRLLLPMVNEAARCLEEGIVTRPLDVDLGMVMGTGFPPFRGGLLRYADARGVEDILARLEALTQTVGPRVAPAEALRRRAAGFYAAAGGL